MVSRLYFGLNSVFRVVSGQRGDDTFSSNLLLAVPILLAGTCGIAAFVTGLIGVVKSRERSILVFLAIFIGFDILVFAAGEFLIPH
jgi:hypothetical protein